ncbi:hypothetical protein BP6252_11356 [Coleophoma cylindrospora]|uniref:STAS domain-containing protein n=1 Tax=Coleophoma cylindrospora TaxID=1849047 RepID=A0A3D8QQ17_9HELO|nr:hypothetical protein BP6252_11356 [Coleophoma cylindrospora]
MAGGKTPMVNIFLSLIAFFCFRVLLPAFYYLPKSILCVMNSIIACSLIEDAPGDIVLFVKLHAWYDITVMTLIFLSTILYSPTMGMTVGVVLSVISIIRHTAKSKIEVLGLVDGAEYVLENAEDGSSELELVSGCLVIRIAERMSFTNTNDFYNRLHSLEAFGAIHGHQSLNSSQQRSFQVIIFDMHGASTIDASSIATLQRIVQSYVRRGVQIYFCNIRGVGGSRRGVLESFIDSGIVEACGGWSHIVPTLKHGLDLGQVGQRPCAQNGSLGENFDGENSILVA